MFYFDDTGEWTYDNDRKAVVFYVNIHNLLYKCVIPRQALESRYGACAEDWLVLEMARDNADRITTQLKRVITRSEYRNKEGTITLHVLN